VSALKATPGPWASFEFGGSHMGEDVGLGVCVAGKSIDVMMGDDDALVCILPDPKAEGNARLIAAAPELYEALRICVNLASKPLQKAMNLKGETPYEIAMRALAKARGEEVSNG